MSKVTIKLLVPTSEAVDSKQDDAYDIFKMKEKFDLSENQPTIDAIYKHVASEILSLSDCDNEDQLNGYIKKMKLRYLDEDGDFVVIRSDKDLMDAIESIAEQSGKSKKISIKIYVRHTLEEEIAASAASAASAANNKNKDETENEKEKEKEKENEKENEGDSKEEKKDETQDETESQAEVVDEPQVVGPRAPSKMAMAMAARAADLQAKNKQEKLEETIVDPIYLIAQLSDLKNDFDSVKKIRLYLQKRDPTFQSGDALQLINKIKSQIRESVSHKYFTNQLRSKMNQLKQNENSSSKGHWMIPWFAVLYNDDINHCLSMISPICSLHYHNVNDKNHKILHEIEGAITAVSRQTGVVSPRDKDRRSSIQRRNSNSQSKENIFSDENRGPSVASIENGLPPLSETKEQSISDVNNDLDSITENRSYLTRLTIATNLEEQKEKEKEPSSKQLNANKLRRKYTVNDIVIDTNKLFGISTLLFLKNAKKSEIKAISKTMNQQNNQLNNENDGKNDNNNESNKGDSVSTSGTQPTKKKGGIFSKFGKKNKDKDKDGEKEKDKESTPSLNDSANDNLTIVDNSNNNNNNNNESNEASNNNNNGNDITKMMLPQYVSYEALEIMFSMLAIHDFFKLCGVCREWFRVIYRTKSFGVLQKCIRNDIGKYNARFGKGSIVLLLGFNEQTMEDVLQICKLKEQEFADIYQPQLSWQFNFHSEYLQRLLRTRTLDENPEWYHKLQLNYTISLQQLEIESIENGTRNETNNALKDEATLAHVLRNSQMSAEDFASHFVATWKTIVSQFIFSNSKGESSHGKRVNIEKFYTSLKPDTSYRIVLNVDMPQWQHKLYSNIYHFNVEQSIVHRINNLRKELVGQNSNDDNNKENEKDNDIDDANESDSKEEKHLTEDEITTTLMTKSLEEYFMLLCSHKWDTTNWALNNIVRIIRQIVRQKSIPIENAFPIELLNNEKYFYSLINHLMILLRRSQYFGNPKDDRWESLDEWQNTKLSPYGGLYTCKMVASLLMLIFEAAIDIFEKGFNSSGGNFIIDQKLKQFQEFVLKCLRWEGLDQSYDGYQIASEATKNDELVKQLDMIIGALSMNKGLRLNGFLAWTINVLCIHQRDSKGEIYEFQLDMFYYLKIIFKALYYLNGHKCHLTKALLVHMSNFKTISTLKQFANGDLLTLSVKMLANVNHDLYSDDTKLEERKVAAQRIIMILSFIKVVYRPSIELLVSDWIDAEEAAALEATHKSAQHAKIISQVKEADSVAELSAALSNNAHLLANDTNNNNNTNSSENNNGNNDSSNVENESKTEEEKSVNLDEKKEEYGFGKTPFSNILDRMFKQYWFIAESLKFQSMVNGIPQILEDCLSNIGAFYYNQMSLNMRQCVRYLDLRNNLIDEESGEIINEGDLHKMKSMKQWLSYYANKTELSMLSTQKEATYNQSCVVLALEYFRDACAFGTSDNFDFINFSTESGLRQYLRSTIYKTTFKLIHSIIEYSFVMATHENGNNEASNENENGNENASGNDKVAAVSALSALFVNPMMDENGENVKDEDLTPQQVIINFLDEWQNRDQSNLSNFEGKLNFLIKIDDYTTYYTEFINRFYMKWIPCYVIVLTHLFEHELNNMANGKYVPSDDGNVKKSKKSKKNKNENENTGNNNNNTSDNTGSSNNLMADTGLSDEEDNEAQIQLSKIEKFLFGIVSVLLLEIVYMPDIYSKYDKIHGKLFETYPWLLKHILAIIFKMSEIEPLFVKKLLSKNVRLLKWIELNSKERQDAGPYRVLEKHLLKLIYLMVIKKENENENESDALSEEERSYTLRVQTILDQVNKLKKSDHSALKTQRGAQTKRQKLWNHITQRNKEKEKDKDNNDSTTSGNDDNNNQSENQNDGNNKDNNNNKDASSVELYDCICSQSSSLSRFMKFDTFEELNQAMYYCDFCSLPIRGNDDSKAVTPVYYCKHKAHHPNGMFVICNHCAHSANILTTNFDSDASAQ